VKLLLAVIQPNKLQPVREALQDMGVQQVTVLDAQGYGRQKGHSAVYGGVEYRVHLLRKVLLEMEVHDDYVQRTIETIERVAKTGAEGNIGDGKVFILPVVDSIAIDGNHSGS
jgi:nitrogen regulatory protein P-II 2